MGINKPGINKTSQKRAEDTVSSHGVCWASVPPPSVTTFFQTDHQLGRLDVAGDGDPGFILFAACTSAQWLSSEPSGRARQRPLLLIVPARILLHLFLFFRWSKLEGPLDTTGIWYQFTHFHKGIGRLGKPMWTVQFPSILLQRQPDHFLSDGHHPCSRDRGTNKPGS